MRILPPKLNTNAPYLVDYLFHSFRMPFQSCPSSLLRNDVTGDHHWIKIKLIGVKSNRSAIGAHDGALRRQSASAGVLSQSSYLSVNDSGLHFGLGAEPTKSTSSEGINPVRSSTTGSKPKRRFAEPRNKAIDETVFGALHFIRRLRFIGIALPDSIHFQVDLLSLYFQWSTYSNRKRLVAHTAASATCCGRPGWH
jgi:hypothetical protein